MRALILTIFAILIFTPLSVQAKDKATEPYIPNVFIYEIPDEPEPEEEIGVVKLNTNANINSPVLIKTEVKYFDHLDVVGLDKNGIAKKNFNIAKPQKIQTTSLKDYNKRVLNAKTIRQNSTIAKAKYRGTEEDIIISEGGSYEETVGNFTLGSNLSTEVNSMSSLDYSSGLFSRYKKKNFALNATIARDQSATSDWYSNSFSIAPELRLSRSLAVKNIMKADMTNNRRSNELVLMLTPFAYKGDDRLNVEVGAGQTFDATNAVLRSKLRFSTNLKL